jgi:hypothetical protein
VWFDSAPLVPGRSYLIKHNVRTLRAKATKIRFRVNMQTLEHESARDLQMNDIAAVEFEAARPLFFDAYNRNRITGSFILIDPLSNATVGAAMIQRELPAEADDAADSLTTGSGGEDFSKAAVTASIAEPISDKDRYERHGHQPALIFVEGRPQLTDYLERALFAQGFEVLRLSADDIPGSHIEPVLKFARAAGLVVILSAKSAQPGDKLRWKTLAADRFFDLAEQDLPADDGQAVARVLSLVRSLRTGAEKMN